VIPCMQHKEPGWGEIKGILSIELQYPLREIKVYMCTVSVHILTGFKL
jgi:hypothetical protein